MKKIIPLIFSLFCIWNLQSQNNSYWQQAVDYKMDVSLDVESYKYKGKQKLIYTNNSADTLRKVYYHLYNNAFQPDSEMDARIQHIADPDRRMVTVSKMEGTTIRESRIKNLKPNEIGYLHVSNFKQDNINATTKEIGTILEVTLNTPILPHSKTTFTLDFEGQVPVQIRRSGRNNTEGVELSMTQWYPKLAEFDFEGWHTDSYIGREFYGVWGNFDVSITLDSNYILGGTGYLENKNEIGYGYQDAGIEITNPRKDKTLTWHFVAPMVHDFTWAADKEYIHDITKGPNNVDIHFLYKNNPKFIQNWKNLQPKVAQLMSIYNQTIGDYPYKQYSVIQGGDGGMEYAMCTLILGQGTPEGLLNVTAHELAHSWFQHVLASNESKHGWMDEGFASFLEDYGLNEIAEKKVRNPFEGAYKNYLWMANSTLEQPQSTHADRFDENRIYSISSYSKGEIFMSQLIYLIGKENTFKTLKRYFNDFKFKHPTPNDIKRSAERISGANLDWYLTDWTQTTNTIDYAIKSVKEDTNKTTITLERIGRMPMPIDLLIAYTDNTFESFYIPLRMMNFEKKNPAPSIKRTVLNDWSWGNPIFEFTLPRLKKEISRIIIDPSGLMADVRLENNSFVGEE